MMVSMGQALRQIGSGPVQVRLRAADFDTRRIGDGAQGGIAVGQALISFSATGFSEVGKESDVWRFVIEEQIPDPQTQRMQTVRSTLYVHGSDILYVNIVSPLS